MQLSGFLVDTAPKIGIVAAVVAALVAVAAIVLLVRRSESTVVAGIGAVALASIAPIFGLVGLWTALRTADAASVGQLRGTRAMNAADAEREGIRLAHEGALRGIAPLLLATVAIVGARKRRLAGLVAVGLSGSTIGAAWAAGARPVPPAVEVRRARLLDARDQVDVDRARGCAELSRAVSDGYDWEPRTGALPADVRAAVPDYDSVATKCARWALVDGSGLLGSDPLASPLLVDPALRDETLNDVDLHPCSFGCAGDDDFGGYGVLGLPPKRNEVRFVTEERTETGPTDYAPDVLRRIVGRAPTRMRVRKCPATAPGNVTVTMTVLVTGKVGAVESTPTPSPIAGPALTDAALVACVLEAMRGVTFPPPDGTVTLTFPIAFDRLK